MAVDVFLSPKDVLISLKKIFFSINLELGSYSFTPQYFVQKQAIACRFSPVSSTTDVCSRTSAVPCYFTYEIAFYNANYINFLIKAVMDFFAKSLGVLLASLLQCFIE